MKIFWQRSIVMVQTAVLLMAAANATIATEAEIERWGIFEISLNGPKDGNPFVDVNLSAEFQLNGAAVKVTGFYDGNGVYCIRFMPDRTGEWKYTTKSNSKELDGKNGVFYCGNPSKNNHGPAGVKDTYHFAYADGKPY